MQRKQNVTNLKYFVLKSSVTPDADSLALHGGFKYLSKFSGNSLPLNRAAFLKITFTSSTLPLHSNHLGDSGTTNLIISKTIEININTKNNFSSFI